MRRLPPLQTLRAFEAAARQGSFTAAARELNITQSAVSQQIQLLEDALGKPLFDRLTRRLALTHAGELFAPTVRQALDMIAEVTDHVRGDARVSDLAVAVIPSLSTRWLVSRLPRFRARHPDIDLALFPAIEPAEIHDCGADLGILYGSGRWRGFRSEELAKETVFPVASPDLASPGSLNVDDIFSFTLLRDADVKHEYWPAWLAAAGARKRLVAKGPRFDNLSDMITAAVEGQGIALVRGLLVADDLRSGRLVRLFETEVQARYAYHLVWSKTPRNRVAGLAFRDWIITEMTSP
jgi:LysR family transcriptional regulator, glycine cleavage system transcriptional activator